MKKYNPFIKAVPVWAKGLEKEMLVTMGLHAKVNTDMEGLILRVATSGFYRVFLDGKFAFYGPARGPHGFFRVDEIPLGACGHVAVEVVNNYVNSYECPCQPGFIQAELALGDNVLSATGDESFRAFILHERVREIQRHSFQRPFAEGYALTSDFDSWRKGEKGTNAEETDIVKTEEKTLIPRNIPLNSFPFVCPDRLCSSGTFIKIVPDSYYKDRSLVYINDEHQGKLKGFEEKELKWHLSDEAQELKTVSLDEKNEDYAGKTVLSEGTFEILSFPCEKTGFICANVRAESKCSLRIQFDEITSENGDINPICRCACNIIRLDLEAGEYSFRSASPQSMKYVKIMVTEGRAEIRDMGISELICPVPVTAEYGGEDTKMKAVFEAARETFLQNSPDLFMDCPSRERAGWLCDSFFTARSEWEFTGDNIIEKNYLENYLLPESFGDVPEGMIPMCYPSDHRDNTFIPNWSLWFILELEDRMFNRKGDGEFVLKFRKRVYGLLDWFRQYENSNGLLEKLPSWVFVEWSGANSLVQDINFPTNMLYARALDAAGRIFGDSVLREKSGILQETIRRLSYDGEFFVDNMVYSEGVAKSSGRHSETCQYYAFFCGTATPESHPELWERLVNEFGPEGCKREKYPEVIPSNAFVGNYLRLNLLSDYGYYSKLNDEIKDYFYYMAERTGTLWEYIDDNASCNHGFASSAVCFIKKIGKLS